MCHRRGGQLTEPDESAEFEPPFGSWGEAVATSAGVGSLAGTIAGVAFGGLGGRAAMRVLFLTSDDRLRGVTSDDGFEVGTISGATIFLVIFTAIAGAIVGAVYGLLRMVTAGPTWAIACGAGLTVAAGGGAVIVNTDGIDFRLFEPLWLAVTLFVFLPGAWAVSVVLLTERLLCPGTVFAEIPDQIGRRRWGAIGWVVMSAVVARGVLDIITDVSELT